MYGIKYDKYVGDGDSSTEHLLVTSNVYDDVFIKKIECKNHLIRNFAKHLNVAITKNVNSKERQPLLKQIHKMTVGIHYVIKHFAQMDPKEHDVELRLKEGIINVIRHYCGFHSGCGSKCDKADSPICSIAVLDQLEDTAQRKLCRFSESLIESLDSNSVEQFHSIVSMFTGGKRINFSCSWGYTYRYFAAVLHFNEGDFMSEYVKNALNDEPNTLLRKTYSKRMKQKMIKKNSSLKTSKNRAQKRTSKKRGLEFYGLDSKKPDMTNNELLEAKKILVTKLKRDQTNRDIIEATTRQQSLSDTWLIKRKNLLTASNFGKIISSKPQTLQNKVVALRSSIFPTKEMELGINMERIGLDRAQQVAKQVFKKEVTVLPTGLFIDHEFYFLGATPDGIFEDGIVEIKTAAAAWDGTVIEGIRNKKITCLKPKKGKEPIQLKQKHPYYYQVQGQLRVTGLDRCIFLLQTKEDFFYEIIERDDQFWKTEMEEKLINFWHFYALEVVDPRKERSMEVRKYLDFEAFCQTAEWRCENIAP